MKTVSGSEIDMLQDLINQFLENNAVNPPAQPK
jgi:hypothetical protein